MAKQYSIEKQITDTHWITLYDEKDFNETMRATMRAIDEVIAYLQDAKEQLVEFKPSDLNSMNNYWDPSLPIELIKNFYRIVEDEDGYHTYDEYGCGAEVTKKLHELNKIAWNMHNQERYADRIEELSHLFRG